MNKEIAYLRALLQSKHQQLQELIRKYEYAQIYQHQWKKVRITNVTVEHFNFIFVHVYYMCNAIRYSHSTQLHYSPCKQSIF